MKKFKTHVKISVTPSAAAVGAALWVAIGNSIGSGDIKLRGMDLYTPSLSVIIPPAIPILSICIDNSVYYIGVT
jgi:hypothetical protein